MRWMLTKITPIIRMSWLTIVVVMCMLSVCTKSSIAQSPAFYTIDNETSAPSNEIYRVIQDRDGYIWIGSNSGLFRYDGFGFKHYSSPDQNSRAISFLQMDGKGRIWSKNFFGQIFRVENDALKLILDFRTSDPNYPQFALDSEGNLFTYTAHQITKYTDNGAKIKSLVLENVRKDETVIYLYSFEDQIIGLTDHFRLFKLDSKTMRLLAPLSSKRVDAKIGGVSSFFIHRGKLHLLTEEIDTKRSYSLWTVDATLGLRVVNTFPSVEKDERIHGIYSDGADIWVFGSRGAFTLDNDGQRQFESHRISSVLRDRSNLLWFSSLDAGLKVIPNEEFISLNVSNGGLVENYITCTRMLSSDELLVGSYTGNLYSYSLSTKKMRPVYENTTQSFWAVKKIEVFKNHLIVSRGRLCIIDMKSGEQHFTKFSNVRDFCIVGEDIYLVFHQFILKMKFRELFETDPKYVTLSKEGGKEIEYDSARKLLVISTSRGTFRVDRSNNWTEIRIKGRPLYASSLCYSKGITWIATISHGLLGYAGEELRYQYSSSNGGIEKTILALRAEGECIWFNSDKYMYRILPKANRIERFGRNFCVNPSDIIHIEANHNKVFLASNKGLFYFPSSIRISNSTRPTIQLLKVSMGNKFLPLGTHLDLKHDNTNVKFHFSSILLKNRGDYTIEYQLEGLSNAWEVVSSENKFVYFAKIPPGNYTLKLRVRDPFGVTSETCSIALSVSRPFYQTWWFLLICFIVLSIAVFALVQKRIQIIRKKEAARNLLIRSQLTALKVQMNPHFMFNTLNSLQDLILNHDFKNTNYYLSKYASLMRLILKNSERNEIGYDEEIEMLDTYLKLEKLRFGDDFTYEIDCDEEILQQNYQLPPMLIQPYIENAVKHGLLHKTGTKQLKISFTDHGNAIVCTVEDNGIGRKASGEINKRQQNAYESFSTDATDKRLKLMQNYHQKTYTVEIIDLENDTDCLGTKVILRFAKQVN